MSNRTKRNRGSTRPAPGRPKPTNSRTIFIVVALIAATAIGVWWWQTQPADAPLPVSPSSANTGPTNAPPPATAAVPRPEFEKLKGKWQRPDGGYVIEIKSVEADGKLDAAYFNPMPIHVARAQAAMDGTVLKVFIELRDVNYPGSTYTLAYDAGQDLFMGIYYQALQQQSFEVNFARMK